MKSVTFTNNISSDLMRWIEKYSASQKTTRRAIMEKALTEFRKSIRKKEYAESFKKASLDIEMGAMAEDGFGDYFKQIERIEQ